MRYINITAMMRNQIKKTTFIKQYENKWLNAKLCANEESSGFFTVLKLNVI